MKSDNSDGLVTRFSGALLYAKTLLTTVAGTILDRLLLHPLDAVIVRQQVDMSSLNKAAVDIFKTDGLLGFYRGMLWPLIAGAPARVSVFATYYSVSQYKPLALIFNSDVVNVGAAVISGSVLSLIAGPAEGKKIREIMHVKLGVNDFSREALFKGFSPLLLRNCISCVVMLAGTDYILGQTLDQGSTAKYLPFFFGTATAMVGQVLATPLDVIKTDIMTTVKPKSMSQAARDIFKRGGYGSFFSSTGSRMLRIGLGSGIMIGTIKTVSHYIEDFSTERSTMRSR